MPAPEQAGAGRRRTQSRRVVECGRRQVGRGGALGAGTGGCGERSPGGGGGPARAVPLRGHTRRAWGRRAVPGKRPREEPGAVPWLPPSPLREGRFPPGRRPGPAGSRASSAGTPSLAPPRPASRRRLGLRGARGAGRGARRAAAAPDMSGPRAGFYRQELNKTLWEVPQRLQGLRPVGSGAYGSVW